MQGNVWTHLRRPVQVQSGQPAAPALETALACVNVGDVNFRTNEPQTARPPYERSLALSRQLAESDPDNADYRRELGIVLYRSGALEQRLNETTAAEGHFRECLRHPRRTWPRMSRTTCGRSSCCSCYRASASTREAGEMAAAIRGRVARDPEAILEVARCYAQCAAAVPDEPGPRGRYEALAVQMLGEAVALGYRDVVSVELDPELEPLRSLAGFQELLA